MFESIEPNRAVKAFDPEIIHEGNRGLAVDVKATKETVAALIAVSVPGSTTPSADPHSPARGAGAGDHSAASASRRSSSVW